MDQSLQLVFERMSQGLGHQDPTGIMSVHVRLVIGEFYRQYIDSNFQEYPCPNSLKKMIELEVELWGKTVQLLERMQTLGELRKPVCLCFYALYLEHQFLAFFVNFGDETQGRKTIEKFQSQNRKLQKIQNDENPFFGETSIIFNQAIDLANGFDQFRVDFYAPVIRARMSLVAHMRSENFTLFNGEKPRTRQGQRKTHDRKGIRE